MEYHAPFVFPCIPPPPGQKADPLRFVAGYKSSEQSGGCLRRSAVCTTWNRIRAGIGGSRKHLPSSCRRSADGMHSRG